jgi:hypothetical protein
LHIGSRAGKSTTNKIADASSNTTSHEAAFNAFNYIPTCNFSTDPSAESANEGSTGRRSNRTCNAKVSHRRSNSSASKF